MLLFPQPVRCDQQHVLGEAITPNDTFSAFCFNNVVIKSHQLTNNLSKVSITFSVNYLIDGKDKNLVMMFAHYKLSTDIMFVIAR